MAEKVVSVKLTASTEGFVAGMRQAKASLDELTKAGKVQAQYVEGMTKAERKAAQETAAAQQKRADAFKSLSDKAAIAGVGIAGAMGLAVKRFANFDQSMSAVAANSGATGQELENLRGLAIKLGADSQFSAKEAADGINEMAKAGVAVQDVMGGGLKGALDLAAAGQIGVADAAETAATAMTQFKLQGDAVPHIADLLANAANKAQGGVGDMAQALKQAGLVASATGLSLDETTAGLTAFASAGLIGSDAGTSFKTMLQRLSAPTDEAAGQMKELGISAYDQQGKFVGLANVAGQLQSAMKDLTPEQRNAAMATIFGNDAIRAANVLYEQGADGINRWTKEVGEQGAAAKQAATLTDNLKGDVERLGGALDSVFIQTGSSANGGLRMLVQGLTGFIDVVGKVPGPVLLTAGALASLALVVPKGVKSYRDYKTQLDTLGLSMDKITTKAPRMATAIRGAEGAMAGLAVAATVGAITNALTDLGELSIDTSKLKNGADAIDVINQRLKATSDLGAPVKKTVSDIDEVLSAAFSPSKGQKFDNFFASINSGLGFENSSEIAVSTERLKELDGVIAGMVASGNAKGAKATFDQIAARAANLGVNVDDLKTKMPQAREALNSVAGEAGASSKAMGDMGKASGDAAGALNIAAAEGNAAASAVLLLGNNADESSDAVKTLAKTIQSDMDGASKAFQSSFDVLGQYDPEKAAEAAKSAAEKVSAAEQKLADLQARIGAKGKLSVSQQQQLSKARAKAADDSAKSTKKEGDARKALSDLEDRLASKGNASVSEQQQLRKAREAVQKARAEAAAADKKVGASGLTAMYESAVADARKFAANISEATKRGLDPQTVAKLLQEGPEKAAPALEALLGKNSRNLIKMSNDAETELRKINGVVVEQARLTSLAVNAPAATGEQMAKDLSTAMGIAQAKAAAGGSATADELVKKLGSKKAEIERIAAEYGIALRIPSPKPPRITVDGADALARIRDVKQELANLNGAKATTYIETRIATERDRRQDAANSKTTGTNLDLFNSPVRRATGGIIPGYSPTATADNILMRATAGEYVLRKAAVDSVGKATLDYLNRHGRLPGYATGGLVGARAQSVPMMLAPSRSSASDGLGRQFVTGSLDMGNGLTGFVRAIVADEMAGARRSSNLGSMG